MENRELFFVENQSGDKIYAVRDQDLIGFGVEKSPDSEEFCIYMNLKGENVPVVLASYDEKEMAENELDGLIDTIMVGEFRYSFSRKRSGNWKRK